MKLYCIMRRDWGSGIYQEIFKVYLDRGDAIFEAKQQQSIRNGAVYDVFEVEGKVVFDGEQGKETE